MKRRAEIATGLKKADENVGFLSGSSVVLLSEWGTVRSMQDALKSKLQTLEIQIEVSKTDLDKLQAQIKATQAEEKALMAAIENYNNIIEFPTNDIRRSQEESGD